MIGQGIARFGARRAVVAVAACVGMLALLPAAAVADEAEALYDPGTVWVIEIDLPQASKEALEADPEGAYQPATMTFKRTDGTPGGIVETLPLEEVDMRLKGSASFKPLSGKAAFKIKFSKEGTKTGPFLGLRKMTLNNMVEDPSMTHETLSYTLHRQLGVPASRTGFAYLRLNGEDFGVYMNVENYDNVAMAKKFGSFDGDVQHVYEGENGADVKPELLEKFEIDEGPDEIIDLEELAAAVGETDPEPWSTAVGPLADLEEMTRMWAAEKYSGQLDGYAGGPGPDHPNNYFLATGPDGLFRMLPWGQDETWKEDNHLPFDGAAGLMFEKCLADSACTAFYEEALEEVQTAVPQLKLDTLTVCTAEMLAPWQQIEEDESTRFEFDAGEIAAAVAETREFIADRPGELADFLGNTAPSEPAPVASCPSEEEPGEQPKPDPAPPVQPPPPTVLPQPGVKVKVGRSRLNGAIVTTRLNVTGPAEAVQLLSVRTGDANRFICADEAKRGTAGRLVLSCRLSGWAFDRLEEGPLKLKVRIKVKPDGQSARSVIRTITAPRR